MADRTPPTVTVDTPIGADVDLERDEVRLADGSRLTGDKAAQIVEQARRAGGRPSLTGKRATSPQIAFRADPDLRDRAAALAAREHKTLSQLAREALEQRVKAS